MNWKALGPLVGVILLAALAFAFWPEPQPPAPPPPPSVAQPTKVLRQLPDGIPAPPPRVAPTPDASLLQLVPTTPNEQPPASLEAIAELERLRELGVREPPPEPDDAGVLHALDRKGFKAALDEKANEIRFCARQYSGVPTRARLEFSLATIPGHERSKIVKVEVPDGGAAADGFEVCVRDSFSGMRFEAPPSGEKRIVVPMPKEKDDTL